eukprot:Protomagalhaensia_wolfi_Nauph_80__596@NODE_1339_length_1577_cov_733_270481_g1034_i0_p2_GENE_NODE_1339_length_1577_cov_733_270481_g1034_i0NODE_1339_length_1577_cov_733_270481_g1034_i0_p2_ORF_typecomplete_len171_score27_47ATPsynt_C/PF00137_21/3_9e15ATPsynt_C/PF00137_21/1_6e17GerA/PF03323_13/3_4GerA/PF03323_13/18_NODE_1339_length_1577_cov_733_270481_g1034_i07851297
MSTNLVTCDPHANLFGYLGITSAVIFANAGSAYGTAKAGLGISSTGVMRPDMVMRNIIPVVMAGILGIYGLIMGIIISQSMGQPNEYSTATGYAHLAGGVTVGLSALVAGFAIGIIGETGVRANVQQPKMFVAMILILIFAEALALYGLIIGLVVSLIKVDNACAPWAME